MQICQYAESNGTVLFIDVLLSSSNLMNLSMRFHELAKKYFFTTLPKEINAVQ